MERQSEKQSHQKGEPACWRESSQAGVERSSLAGRFLDSVTNKETDALSVPRFLGKSTPTTQRITRELLAAAYRPLEPAADPGLIADVCALMAVQPGSLFEAVGGAR